MARNLFKRKTANGVSNDDATVGRNSVSHTSQDLNNIEVNDKDAPQGRDKRHRDVPYVTLYTGILTVIISMGGFIFGYDTGQISGILETPNFLQLFGQYGTTPDGTQGYYFSNVRSGLIVSLLSIGTLIGALVAAPIADRVGRRWSIIAWAGIFSIGVLIQVASEGPNWVQIVMGRWVAGLGVGALSLLVPMYQSETSPRHIRGALVSCYQLFVTLGIFVADCINFGTETRNDTGAWRIPMAVGWLWAIILAGGMFFQRESPRYDIRHGRIDAARKTFSLSNGVPSDHVVINNEISEIQEALDIERANKAEKHWTDAFTAPAMKYRLALGMSLQMFQQLTGANYFFYYGTTIFTATGINNSYVTAMILGGVNFGSTFLGLWFIERFGRRKCLIFGALWMFACFLVFASVGAFALDNKVPQNTPSAGAAMIVFACLFIVAFATTWGPMVWSVNGELFPGRHRAFGMSLSTASNWGWNFLLAFFTPFITGDIGFKFGYVFAGCNLAAAATVYFFVIEPKGKTLEEIDTMYVTGVSPRKSGKYDTSELREKDEGPNPTVDRLQKRHGENLENMFPNGGQNTANNGHSGPITGSGVNATNGVNGNEAGKETVVQ